MLFKPWAAAQLIGHCISGFFLLGFSHLDDLVIQENLGELEKMFGFLVEKISETDDIMKF